jgi:DNA-binding HxlR family transcriptional regulator
MATKRTYEDVCQGKRTYEDSCRFAHALDLLGERWTLLIVRELLLGPKRFTDLREGLPHVSPNVLSQRLRELERTGVLVRRTLPPPAASRVYELTEWGQELESVVIELGRWGARSPTPPRQTAIGVDSIVLALRSVFDPDAAAGVTARYELRFGEERFRVEVSDGELELARGEVDRPEAIFETDPDTLSALLTGNTKPAEALRSGKVTVAEGGREALARFLSLFTAPEPVDVPLPA